MSEYSLIEDGKTKSKKSYHRPNITKKHIKQFFFKCVPIISWLPSYSVKSLQCDAIAGITVGLMVVPQALAYASIAQLPNQYGLYSAFMGCFVYCIFGTSKDITLGPTAILSLLVSTYSVTNCGDMAVMLSFCVGVILLVMGVFRLGFLLRFLPLPVIEAFTSAAAITIACGQLKSLNGVAHTPRDFFGNLITVFKKWNSWNFYDVGFGLICILILLLMRYLSKIKWIQPEMSRGRTILCKLMWFCGIARNAIVVIVSCIVLYIMDTYLQKQYLTHVGVITSGLPPMAPPKFVLTCHNLTYTFTDIVSVFGSGLLVVPLIAFLEALAIGKAFSQLNQYKIRPSQELIALGIANIAGSFVSAYPVTGSFSRTAVNSQSGVKTPLAGLFTGVIVVIATQFLGGVFCYIPKACLGAVIISAVLPMISISAIREMWKIRKLDLLPYIVTFLGCFYTLEVGLGIGFAVSLCLVLYHVATPQVETTFQDRTTVLHLHSGVLYPGVERVVSKIENLMENDDNDLPAVLVIDMKGVLYIDFTALVELQSILGLFESNFRATKIMVRNVDENVRTMVEKSKMNKFLVSEDDMQDTEGASTSS